MYMIIIKLDCCGRPQTSSDAMQFKRLDVLRRYAGKRVNVLVPLKCTCMPFFMHSFLNFSPVFWNVWNYNGDVLFVVGWWNVVVVVVGGGDGGGLDGVGKFVLPLVEGPVWKLTLL